MKKICFLVLILFITDYLYSQESHIEFKGIPLNGSLSSFVEKMKREGFKFKEYSDNSVAIMEGLFTGKNVEIFVISSSKTKTVWKVSSYYEGKESWLSLKRDYNEMVELFKKKYGEPVKHFEFFSKPYYEGDGYEMQALKKEKCFYASFWETDKGTMIVEITEWGQIRVGYEDRINIKVKQKEELEDSMNDI